MHKKKLQPCPYCCGKHRGILTFQDQMYLEEPAVQNCLSRRDNETYICKLCGKAETMTDFLHRDLDYKERLAFDALYRTVAGQEFNEALRLPVGGRHGTLGGFQTGGLEEHFEKFDQIDWGFKGVKSSACGITESRHTSKSKTVPETFKAKRNKK